MFAQPFYMIHTFPYDDVVTTQIDEKEKGSSGLMFFGKQPQFSMMTISCAMGKSFLPIGPIWFSFYDQTNMGLEGQNFGVVFSWTRVQLPHMTC